MLISRMLTLDIPNEKLLASYFDFIDEMRLVKKSGDGFLPREGQLDQDFLLGC